MMNERKSALDSILTSYGGTHLSIYLRNNADVIQLKTQLKSCVAEADEFLQDVWDEEERRRFLDPLNSMLEDPRILKGIKDNIGLFRTKDFFRVHSLPVELETQIHLANSFHVKPILKWLQNDFEFFVLGLNEESATLYQGSRTLLQKLDTAILPHLKEGIEVLGDYANLKKVRRVQWQRPEVYKWLAEWTTENIRNRNVPLFVIGKKKSVDATVRQLKYENAYRMATAGGFSEKNISEYCSIVRRRLREEIKIKFETNVLEFHVAENNNLSKTNIFEISKLAAEGNVRKLMIADGVHIYGKVNKRTGQLKIHPFDLDHEDDDILDDLAQLVLAGGGEVTVAPITEMPSGVPAVAIPERTTDLRAATVRFEREVTHG